ncbi:hypothetical protein AWC38_SpisGene23132 [Stylophora pistillata]|uniref:Uncharacterized protein n=1 Tax=Stylophora pistillata TaxID=50429 RepID=A0A2B4R3D0_STYPI|nr:hypothetical protein AWC38_SpisGene23132 [Stylophora pistillata]
MDELLAEMNNLKQVKRDSKSLTRCATTISVFVNDMKDSGYIVLEASEAPFFMSQLLSKLDQRDNTNFGREMQRAGKEENVSNLVTWLHREATLRSRGKRDNDNADEKERTHPGPTFRRTDNHAANNDRTPEQEACPLGCTSKHQLAACPLYQSSIVNKRWDVVKQSNRCRKCLRPHHTNDCRKPDGGEKRSEASEIIEINITSTINEDVRKTLEVYAIKKPCSAAKTISKETIKHFSHLKPAANKLHLSGGTIDLLIGTDFVDAFVDIHTLSGEPREPISKCNCFGWYVLGQVNSYRIQSVAVGTVRIEDDFKKLLYQDTLGVKPTELCICSENVLRENKFVKSLSDSTTLVDGRIQVRMPWNENGPPERSNYDIALKRMQSAEKSIQKKGCSEIVNDEVQKLLQQDFIIKVLTEEVDHSQPEWYLPLQAVLPPEKTTKVRLVFDASSKGHDGLS